MAGQPKPTVQSVLIEYHDKVSWALAGSHSLTNAFPAEVLNEVRNAFTHLSKAQKLGNKDPDYTNEVSAALRHLKRVQLDCYKLNIFFLTNKADQQLSDAAQEKQLPDEVWDRAAELREERTKLGANEAQMPTHVAVDEYLALYLRYQDYTNWLNKNYSAATAAMRLKIAREQKAEQEKQQSRKFWNGIAIGGLVGTIGSAVVALVIAYGQGTYPFSVTASPQTACEENASN